MGWLGADACFRLPLRKRVLGSAWIIFQSSPCSSSTLNSCGQVLAETWVVGGFEGKISSKLFVRMQMTLAVFTRVLVRVAVA